MEGGREGDDELGEAREILEGGLGEQKPCGDEGRGGGGAIFRKGCEVWVEQKMNCY